MFTLKINELFLSGTKEIIAIAPMGWGKTLMALYYIHRCCSDLNTLIVLTPAVLKVWMEELIKIGWIHSDPVKSKVLVKHNIRPKHNKYYTENIPYWSSHKIIITTNVYKDNGNGPETEADVVIFDEYHKPQQCSQAANAVGCYWPFNPLPNQLVNGIMVFNPTEKRPIKVLGLTAEDVVSSPSRKILKLKDEDYSDKLPTVSLHYYTVDNGMNTYAKKNVHIADVKEHGDLYKYQLLAALKGKRKVVISVDRGYIGDEIRKIINSTGRYKIFELLSSMVTVDRFLKYDEGRAILFIGSNNNEGLNILAKHLIIIKPDTMNCARIRQTINRIRRPNNPNRKLTCNFILGGEIALIKTFYASCYGATSWPLDYNETPGEKFLLKCVSVLRLLGCNDILELSIVDGCIIFDSYRGSSRYKKVIKWWEENREENTVLSIEVIKNLYI